MQKESGKQSDEEITELLAKIEQGDIPLKYLLNRLIELLTSLHEKERQLEQYLRSMAGLADLQRKVTEIHTLHFPADELKKVSRQERLLAQILTKPIRKR